MSISSGPSPVFRPVMVFIDGGYLRKELKEKFERDDLDVAQFSASRLAPMASWSSHVAEVVRTYFYDAVVPATDDTSGHSGQMKYFDRISRLDGCEVKLGTIVTLRGGGTRQKGVDTLLAIDMVAKAYANHYDVAILCAGDSDLEPVVKAVKDAGKRVCGAYFPKSASKRLVKQFDQRKDLAKENFATFWLAKP